MRLPPLPDHAMTPAQRAAADELIAGPRKAVKGPFIALLRSPELLAHVQKLGAFLRFGTSLPVRVSEFATLLVARHWRQQFEWKVHVALALQAGTAQATIDALRDGRRPDTMDADETLVHDFCTELLAQHGVSETTWARTVARFTEAGAVELTGLVGYFAMVSMVLNVGHIPAEPGGDIAPLPVLPP